MSLKLLVIDDHPLVQEGIAAALQSLGGDTRVLAAKNGEEGMNLAAANPDLDLVLLDLALPGMSGFGLITRLHERLPSLPVVVLSALEEPENVRQAINAGAMGFVPKSASPHVLIDAVKDVLEGNISVPESLHSMSYVNGEHEAGAPEPPQPLQPLPDVSQLTLRQLEVLSRICQGKTNRQVATELKLSEKTVKAHVTQIFKALGVVNRTQAVLVARRLGLMTS
jgi:two-component system, NarL family, nitrate/nitrite response regulator NarL